LQQLDGGGMSLDSWAASLSSKLPLDELLFACSLDMMMLRVIVSFLFC
jgi:hypothetical protein